MINTFHILYLDLKTGRLCKEDTKIEALLGTEQCPCHFDPFFAFSKQLFPLSICTALALGVHHYQCLALKAQTAEHI